jgi:hypothetical protein
MTKMHLPLGLGDLESVIAVGWVALAGQWFASCHIDKATVGPPKQIHYLSPYSDLGFDMNRGSLLSCLRSDVVISSYAPEFCLWRVPNRRETPERTSQRLSRLDQERVSNQSDQTVWSDMLSAGSVLSDLFPSLNNALMPNSARIACLT